MTANNVVEFPLFEGTEPTSLEAIRERVDVIREVFVEAAAEAVTSLSIQSMKAAGYPIHDYYDGREIMLIQNAIKSLMMKTRGMEHPLQETAQTMFVLTDPEDYWAEEAELE